MTDNVPVTASTTNVHRRTVLTVGAWAVPVFALAATAPLAAASPLTASFTAASGGTITVTTNTAAGRLRGALTVGDIVGDWETGTITAEYSLEGNWTSGSITRDGAAGGPTVGGSLSTAAFVNGTTYVQNGTAWVCTIPTKPAGSTAFLRFTTPSKSVSTGPDQTYYAPRAVFTGALNGATYTEVRAVFNGAAANLLNGDAVTATVSKKRAV